MEMSEMQLRVYKRLLELKTPQTVNMLSRYFFVSESSIYNTLVDLQEMNCAEHLGFGMGWRAIRRR